MEGFAGVTVIKDKFGTAPVPLKDAVCGLLLALSVKVRVPLRDPCPLGENDTDTLQLARAANDEGQLEFTTKSLRLLEMEVIVNAVD